MLDNVFDWVLGFQKDKFLVLGMKCEICISIDEKYEGWNFNSGNYLFTTDTK